MSQARASILEPVLARLARSREDKEAWTLLYDLMWGRVLATMFRSMRGLRDAAEDASQEVFIRLLQYCDFRKFDTPDDFQRYVRAVAQNVAKDQCRWITLLAANADKQEDGEEVDKQEDGEEVFEHIVTTTPEQVVSARQLLQQLRNELKADEKALLELLVDGYTVPEIAARSGWSYTNAGVRLHRLRKRIRKSLKQTDKL